MMAGLHTTILLFALGVACAIQLPCEIHVHVVIDGAREPSSRLERRPRGCHIVG